MDFVCTEVHKNQSLARTPPRFTHENGIVAPRTTKAIIFPSYMP